MSTPQRPTVLLDGRPVINFSANNYLALADHPSLVAGATAALAEFGAEAGAARLTAGNQPPHLRLEAELAGFHHAEAALLFNSGYQANLGVLSALAGPEDAIFSDALNHASLIDGCRLSRAKIHSTATAIPPTSMIGSPSIPHAGASSSPIPCSRWTAILPRS